MWLRGGHWRGMGTLTHGRRVRPLFTLILGLLVLLTMACQCSSPPVPEPTPTAVSPTATHTAVSSPSPEISPTASATATATQTDTPEPTATVTAVPATPEPTATALPTAVPTSAPLDTYTVQADDWLIKIAIHLYGGRYGWQWRCLHANNRAVIGADPNLIYRGQVLRGIQECNGHD